MAEQVPEPVRRERLERLLDVQRGISLECNEARVGRVESVLIDRAEPEDGYDAVGRTRGQALEVDGVIHLRGGASLEPGMFARVRVAEAQEHDLVGDVVREV
jgi:ribosomal protein S12 methylthiotransferase